MRFCVGGPVHCQFLPILKFLTALEGIAWVLAPLVGRRRDYPSSGPLCDDALATDGFRTFGRQHPVQAAPPVAASVRWAAKPRARSRGAISAL
jgi:hypothetical protein